MKLSNRHVKVWQDKPGETGGRVSVGGVEVPNVFSTIELVFSAGDMPQLKLTYDCIDGADLDIEYCDVVTTIRTGENE